MERSPSLPEWQEEEEKGGGGGRRLGEQGGGGRGVEEHVESLQKAWIGSPAAPEGRGQSFRSAP